MVKTFLISYLRKLPQLDNINNFYCNIYIYIYIYDGWNFNSGNYLFTADTK